MAKEQQGLLEDILEHPDDQTPRLVYADWLEEHAQPETAEHARGEFIRVQCAMAKLPTDDPHRRQMEARSANLLSIYRKQWTPYAPKRMNLEFAGGFVTTVRGNIREYRRHIGKLLETQPIREAEIINPFRDTPIDQEYDELADDEETEQSGIRTVFSLAGTKRLRRIRIEAYDPENVTASLAREMMRLPELQKLEIRDCRLNAGHLLPILRTPGALPSLLSLDLSGNALGVVTNIHDDPEADALRAFMETEAFPGLQELDVRANRYIRDQENHIALPLLFPGTTLHNLGNNLSRNRKRILEAILRAQER